MLRCLTLGLLVTAAGIGVSLPSLLDASCGSDAMGRLLLEQVDPSSLMTIRFVFLRLLPGSSMVLFLLVSDCNDDACCKTPRGPSFESFRFQMDVASGYVACFDSLDWQKLTWREMRI